MSLNRPDHSQGGSILMQIHEGMEVYDRDKDRIGTVDEVYFGEASPRQQDIGKGPAEPSDNPDDRANTIVGAIARAFDPREVPDVVAARLIMSGYIRLDTAGLFTGDRYITPDQILSVENDRVYLGVTRSQLIKPR